MKKTIIALGILSLISSPNFAFAQNPDHTIEVTPGDWDDDDPTLNFNFKDIPLAKYEGLKLHISCALPNAKIFYTSDATADPSDETAWTLYSEPLYLTEDCTIRFFGRCEGYNDSEIQNYVFVYADHQAAAPSVAPDMERKNIVMTTDNPEATIRYTFDGSDPTETSSAYDGPLPILANGTFKARSFAKDMFPSSITEYTIDFLKAEMPSAAFIQKKLVLSSEDAFSKIYYTLSDAPISDANAWNSYSTPLALTEDCTIRYFARHNGYHDSEVGAFAFSYSAYQVATPILTADAEGTHVLMECATEGAIIRYTTDGSEPTEESEIYTEPIEIRGEMTVRARAFADGLFNSEISELAVSEYSAVKTVNLNGVRVCKEGSNLVVYSDTVLSLPVYTIDGYLHRVVNVEPGRNIISDLDSNLYIIGSVKIKL